jgi:hypothetical protein
MWKRKTRPRRRRRRARIAPRPAQTRDVIMNEYLCEVYKGADSKLDQKVLATYDHVKDEYKVLGIGECGKKTGG